MTVPVLQAAKHLARRSGWRLSNLQLQKILYLAHMVHLGRAREPLVHGEFEAWDYGPVHPRLYRSARIFGRDPVENIWHDVPDLAPGPEAEILDEALNELGNMPGGALVRATHHEGGAWYAHYQPGARHIPIPNVDIEAEYRRRA